MPPQPMDIPTVVESSDLAKLPHFRDRLPDLLETLQSIGNRIQALPNTQSYIPYWEDLYTNLHGLKGVTQILPCEPELASFIVELCESVLCAYGGNKILRDYKKTGALLLRTKDCLAKANFSGETAQNLVQELQQLFTDDLPHREREKLMPAHLFYVNDFVSKKFRETQLLNINHCVIEDEIFLNEIPEWRKKLDAFLDHEEYGRGFIINFLPFIQSEGSRKVKIWAWIALATPTRATLKQRIKESIPQVTITKI